MKITPIINQLATYLPYHTDKFTDSLNIVSATQQNGIATIQTDTPHNLNQGAAILLTNIEPLIQINSAYLLTGNQLSINTTLDNGLVDSFDFFTNKSKNFGVAKLYLTGFDEPQFNGAFPIISVPNRFNVVCQLPDEITSPPNNFGQLIKYAANAYVGKKTITNVVNDTTFQFVIESSAPQITSNSGKIHYHARISGVVNIERAIESYTREEKDKYWLFVSQNESVGSKNRQILNDGLDSVTNGAEYRQALIDSINVFVFVPTSDKISGAYYVDDLENIKIALFKALLRFNAPQQYSANSVFQLYFQSTSLFAYSKAYMIQQFIFESEYYLTYFDGFSPDFYTPFRDIYGDANAPALSWNVDLDDDLNYT